MPQTSNLKPPFTTHGTSTWTLSVAFPPSRLVARPGAPGLSKFAFKVGRGPGSCPGRIFEEMPRAVQTGNTYVMLPMINRQCHGTADIVYLVLRHYLRARGGA
jgi:hypothetical protein